jgi:hypothetical protein
MPNGRAARKLAPRASHADFEPASDRSDPVELLERQAATRVPPLFLQIKEAQPSVLEAHLGANGFANQGERVVVGQRLMQAGSDIFLGWLHADCDYYGRQLRDWKAAAEIEELRPESMAVYGRMCGWTLARAHARTGDRVAIAAYLGNSDSFDRAILAFSQTYAEQNDRDFRALREAADSGRIVAEAGL